jgi:hypothetical protein
MLESLTAALYLYSYRFFHSIHAGSQALFEGFWLGLLSEAAIDIITQRSYKDWQYSGSAYLDSGFQFWEEIAISRFFPPGGAVLVASAGGGRELIALTRAGFTADGFECSRPMVAAGSHALSLRGIGARLQWAPPCRIPEISGTYDAAIIGWNGYTYISPPERRISFMKSLLPHLRPGAPVLVSGALRSAPGVASLAPRVANLVRVLTFRAPAFTTGATFPGRPRHQFAPDQLEAELNAAGYAAAAFWKWGGYCAVVCLRNPETESPRTQSPRTQSNVDR